MCGIAGYIGREELSKNKILNTLNSMTLRGPDNQNYVKFNFKNEYIYLLHSRLSIIDLDKRSNQPFQVGDYTLIFNGEIYNYEELSKILKKRKIKLKTNSDTEVLLWFYIIFGKNCLKYFEGMWSFAIYNNKTNKLFISRDRFGEKPLFFFRNSKGFFFASEIKILKKLIDKNFEINQNKIKDYLKFGYKSLKLNNQTFFKGIEEFKSSTFVEFDLKKELRFIKYWTPKFKENSKLSIEDTIIEAKEKLIESVKIRLRSDVPIAFCLSGGIDSSSLASIATKILNKNIKTFSIVEHFSQYNEKKIITQTVKDLSAKHEFIYPSSKNFYTNLEKMILNNNSPISTISYFLHNLISKKINKSGYKVSISGTGADELFTGYYSHFILHLLTNKTDRIYPYLKNDFRKLVVPFIRNKIFKKEPNILSNMHLLKMTFDENIFNSNIFNFKKKIKFNKKFTKNILKNRMLNELFFEVIPPILHEDDHNSMAYSIENRSPFLDKSLFETCYSIPSKYLIKFGFNKFILRNAMKGIVNEDVLNNRQKIGFNSSISKYLKHLHQDEKMKILDKKSKLYDYLNYKKFNNFFNKKNISNSESKFLFNSINMQIFLERFN